jgi:hypothetical protein
MEIHLCTVCGKSGEDHGERCGCCDELFWPPLCCPGCDCGAFEDAHAERLLVRDLD